MDSIVFFWGLQTLHFINIRVANIYWEENTSINIDIFSALYTALSLSRVSPPQRFPCFSVNSFSFPCLSVIFCMTADDYVCGRKWNWEKIAPTNIVVRVHTKNYGKTRKTKGIYRKTRKPLRRREALSLFLCSQIFMWLVGLQWSQVCD